MPFLTLGFSAMAPRFKMLLDWIPELDPETYEILIGVQGATSSTMNIPSTKRARLLYLDSQGLSRSRNAIIEHATGKYIWFLDDDIRLAPGAANTVFHWLIEHDDVDVLQVRIGSMECPDRPYKHYATGMIRRFNMLQISSIEMIARSTFIKRHGLRFLDEIGIGTQLPSGEENWFALDLCDAGASFAHLPETLVFHRTMAERWKPNRGVFFVRGAIAGRFGILAPLLIVRWWLRILTAESMIAMLRGLIAFRIHKERAFTSSFVQT